MDVVAYVDVFVWELSDVKEATVESVFQVLTMFVLQGMA